MRLPDALSNRGVITYPGTLVCTHTTHTKTDAGKLGNTINRVERVGQDEWRESRPCRTIDFNDTVEVAVLLGKITSHMQSVPCVRYSKQDRNMSLKVAWARMSLNSRCLCSMQVSSLSAVIRTMGCLTRKDCNCTKSSRQARGDSIVVSAYVFGMSCTVSIMIPLCNYQHSSSPRRLALARA